MFGSEGTESALVATGLDAMGMRLRENLGNSGSPLAIPKWKTAWILHQQERTRQAGAPALQIYPQSATHYRDLFPIPQCGIGRLTRLR